MQRRAFAIIVGCASIAAIALPTAASAATKTVSAGPPGNGTAQRLLGKAFLKKYSPDVNDFFLHRVTINQGDTIRFLINGFHTVDLPGSSGQDLPFIVSGATVSGAKDAAGNPFWFNGRVPSLGINPQLLSHIGGSTYNGRARVDSGIFTGNGNPPPFPVTFTKPGTYKYFCDVHPGMVGYVVVRPRGQRVPSARQDAAALARQVSTDIANIQAAVLYPPNAVYLLWPTPEAIARANVTRLMRRHGIADIEQLRSRSVADIDWFWDAVVKDLELPFSQPYGAVRDSSAGIEWTTWFIDGHFNAASACVGRWRDGPRASSAAVVHEDETGAVGAVLLRRPSRLAPPQLRRPIGP